MYLNYSIQSKAVHSMRKSGNKKMRLLFATFMPLNPSFLLMRLLRTFCKFQ